MSDTEQKSPQGDNSSLPDTVDERDLYAPDGGDSPDERYPFLTEYQAQRLQDFLDEAEFAYEENPIEIWGNDPNAANAKTEAAEKRIFDYIGLLLAQRDARITALNARQITPAMAAAWDEYVALRDERAADDMIVYPSEMNRFQSEVWRAFDRVMTGEMK